MSEIIKITIRSRLILYLLLEEINSILSKSVYFSLLAVSKCFFESSEQLEKMVPGIDWCRFQKLLLIDTD